MLAVALLPLGHECARNVASCNVAASEIARVKEAVRVNWHSLSENEKPEYTASTVPMSGWRTRAVGMMVRIYLVLCIPSLKVCLPYRHSASNRLAPVPY